jgi:cyclophilin family peptidyl-prolyl cis-trans isomerase
MMTWEDSMDGKIKIFLMIVLLPVLALFSGCKTPKYPAGLYAELQTTKGLIVLKIDIDNTPVTAMNFVGLAEGTIKNDALPLGTPYFDGTVFQRVVPNHVIQAGSPAAGPSQPLGYTIPNEIHSDLSHGRAGMLGMANRGPHTNGSQFYITLGDRSYLDGDYTVFGEVAEGMDVVNSIVQGDSVETVLIVRVGRSAKAFRPDAESFLSATAILQKSVEKAEAERKETERAHIKNTWPDLESNGKGIYFKVLDEGQGPAPSTGSILKVLYSGQKLLGEGFNSSAEGGVPKGDGPAEEFDYQIGESRLNPGLDHVIPLMREGERRLVLLLPEAAYGESGFYARQIPGHPRFVISPRTTLVYEIEILDSIN